MHLCSKSQASYFASLIALILVVLLPTFLHAPLVQAAGTITGVAFRDFNANGIKDNTNEIGVSGVTVTAYDAVNAAQGSAVTATDGTYSLTTTGTGPYRVEFSGWSSYLQPSAHGSDNGTSVQFVPDGTQSNINLALNDPTEYCQANPDLCTSLYVNGDPTSSVTPFDTLTKSPYASLGATPTQTSLGTKSQVGSTWGLSYGRQAHTLYAAAFLKRHTGLGPSGLGAIYQVPNANAATSGTPTLLVDLAAAAQGIDVGQSLMPTTRAFGDPNTPTHDPEVFSLIGKVGLGGMGISDDGATLWVTNLYTKKLLRIPVANPTSTNIISYPIPNPSCAGTDEHRPFGVKVYHGAVYVGVVCDGQNSNNVANLKAIVYRFDPSVATFTNVLEFPLTYTKGFADASCPAIGNWNTWSDTFVTCDGFRVIRPQPILSDIAFDADGSMVLGFMDRTGHQTGAYNYSPDLADTTSYVGIPGGEVLRAYNNSGTFQLESNGAVGGLSGGLGNAQGPNGGEFYQGDNYTQDGVTDSHQEVSLGGIALKVGSGEVATTAFDAIQQAGYLRGGVRFLSNTDGVDNRAYQIHNDGGEHFGKANGLGDLELLCDAAPIEIGNRVWNDANANGIQDADELGIDGVTVDLWADTNSDGTVDTKVGTVTTANNGQYYFGGASNQNLNVGQSVKLTTAYQVQINSTQTALNSLKLTTANVGGASGDSRDSDATLSVTTAVANVLTGGAGFNDHTVDFGFRPLYSIGNRVWADTNNDGTLVTASESGLSGVTVSLFADANVDGNPDSTIALQTVTTDASGYYRFDTLDAGTYVVRVDPVNFASTGNLAGYTSSGPTNATPNNNADNDNNGIANATPATNGILSGPITLGPGTSEPTGEADVAPTGQGSADAYANMTVDFGFYRLSIGNQLWFDTNNNGVLDGTETGTAFANVRVELYDGSTLVAVATTNATGAYLFDRKTDATGTPNGVGLAPSNAYKVVIPASEFATGKPLADYVSSTGATSGVDSNDNGVDTLALATNGIASAVFALQPGSATGGATLNAVTGTTSNPTLDFGFYTLSLGDRVFTDANNNGIFDGSDAGIDGVTVNLYRDNDKNGVPDGAAVATQTTSSGGYYLFTALTADTYIVEVVPPAGYISSTGKDGSATGAYEPGKPPNTDITDNDDNGTASGSAIRSAPVTLTVNGAPTGEAPLVGIIDPATDLNSNRTVDFGLFRPLSLGNLVWNDTNNNGVVDSGELGIPNVPVTLYRDSNKDGFPDGAALATTMTNAGGNYQFNYLSADNYVVEITTPAGYTSSTGKNGSSTGAYEPAPNADNDADNDDNGTTNGATIRSTSVTLTIGGEPITDGDTNPDTNLTVDFGVFQPATLGDLVWFDTTPNGVQDVGEMGVPNVTATLFNASTNSVVATTTTDTNGGYLFNNLIPGGYYVIFSNLPATYGFVLPDQGGNDASDSDVNQITGKTGTYTLVSGQNELTVDAGIAVANTLRLGNLVWADYNDNGKVDVGEPGMSGVPVDLLDSTGTVVLGNTTTAMDGTYAFSNLSPGDYRVRVPASAFAAGGPLEHWSSSNGSGVYEPAPNSNGDIDNDDNGTATVNGVESTSITLTLGGEPDTSVDGDNTNGNLTLDFGVVPQLAALGDFVWYDANRNNVQDPSETGVPNVAVTLYRADNTIVGSTKTDASGKYLFSNLVPGDYYVIFDRTSLPSSYRFVATNSGNDPALDSDADILTGRAALTTLAAGETDLTWDAGVYQLASLGDFVWIDANSNGAQDSSEPGLAGVIVSLLDGNGSVLRTTATDSTGHYLFASLEPGAYAIQFALPNGYSFTTLNSSGATKGTDSDANPATGRTVVIPLAAGQSDLSWDAGLRGAMSLGNLVWQDTNNNGVVDVGEAGISGVPITLYRDSNHDGLPDGPALVMTTTDATGHYVFVNLLPDTYVVEVAPLAGYRSSTGTNGSASGPYEPAPDANNDLDNDDNGTTNGKAIRSALMTLSIAGEPITDGDTNPNSNLTLDLGLFQPASLGSIVWFDANQDGVKQANEAGVPDVLVTLYDAMNNPIATIKTDANGAWQFTNLIPGTYTIGFSNLPSGTTLTAENQGGDDGNDSDADPRTSRTSAVTLRPGENNPTLYAGIMRPTAITLASFTATRQGETVLVRWTTAAELDTFSFNLYRSTTAVRADATRVTAQAIAAKGRRTGGASYFWTDTTAQAGVQYYYWLQETEVNGSTHEYGPATLAQITQAQVGQTSARMFLPLLTR